MKHILFVVSALALVAGTAFAQSPTVTIAETGGTHRVGNGSELPQGDCWFNGTTDFRSGFTSERNTDVAESWTFDDVQWTGGRVTGFRGNFTTTRGTQQFSAVDLIIYQGLAEGTFGTLIVDRPDITNFTLTPTGNKEDELLMVADLGGQAFNLDPGTYHVGIRLVGVGTGRRAFVVTTSGADAVGTPPGNNGQTFIQSNFFGIPLPTDWQNVVGPGTWDVSYGLDCEQGGGYTLALSGDCPGTVRLEWSGADANRQQGIVFARNTGNFVIPNGPCQGTQLGLGTNQLQLFNIISTGSGSGSVNAQANQGACRGFVQLIQTHSCVTSNIGQVP